MDPMLQFYGILISKPCACICLLNKAISLVYWSEEVDAI